MWQMKILTHNGLKFFEKIVSQWTKLERRRLTISQYVLQYIQVALGQEWPNYWYFSCRTTFTHAQYINIMYLLDLTQQKFDVLIAVA